MLYDIVNNTSNTLLILNIAFS